MAKKGAYYARRFVLGKKFGTILLMGQEKDSGKLYYGKPCLVYMLCSFANAERQHTTTYDCSADLNITTGTVCTDSV